MDSYDRMIKDTTEQAELFINMNSGLYLEMKAWAMKEVLPERKAPIIENLAKVYARRNEDSFGSLFIAELDAVDWNEIVRRVF